MATDGVKIIDGDLAHDIYRTFLEMYDAGATLAEITSAIQVPFGEEEEDGFDYEIFITVYAFALWQTGQLTTDVIQEVDDVIARGIGVRVWTEECGKKEGQKRQRELENLRKKLDQHNRRIRKRKNYKLLTKFLFEENSILAFQLPNGNYCASILVDIFQHQGRCTYYFAESIYLDTTKPTVDDIINAEVVVRIMKSFGFEFGFAITAVSSKDLRTFVDEFEKIGIVKISAEAKKVGSYGGARSFESFCQNWINQKLYVKNLDLTTTLLKNLLQTESGD